MKARIDIRFSRAQIERFFKVFEADPNLSFATANCTIDISEIKFDDSYTELTCGTEICSTTAIVRCK